MAHAISTPKPQANPTSTLTRNTGFFLVCLLLLLWLLLLLLLRLFLAAHQICEEETAV